MAAKVDIYNMAITLLGGKTVSSPTENTKNAIAISAIYEMTRLAELRKSPAWNFSILMAELAESATPPLFTKAHAYPLPTGFVAMCPPFPETNYNDRDWIIQNGMIYTNYDAPLQIRYVSNIVDTTQFDPLFAKSFAARLAADSADSIVQSNSKIELAEKRYTQFIEEAKKANAFDNVSVIMPLDEWLTVRL